MALFPSLVKSSFPLRLVTRGFVGGTIGIIFGSTTAQVLPVLERLPVRVSIAHEATIPMEGVFVEPILCTVTPFGAHSFWRVCATASVATFQISMDSRVVTIPARSTASR